MQRTARPEQSKPVARAVRKPHPAVCYHGREQELSVHRVTLSIRGQRYAYTLTPSQCDTVEFLCRKGLGRRALNFAKSRARNVDRIGPTTSATSTS